MGIACPTKNLNLNEVLAMLSIRSDRTALFSLVSSMVFCTALTVNAGVIQDDIDPIKHVNLAANYSTVGQVFTQTNSGAFYAASATVIGSNWILTAAHVVDDITSLTFNFASESEAASSWFAHEDWNGDLGKGYDIALVRFDNLDFGDFGITPATLYRGSDEIGRVGTSVGYGLTGTGSTGFISNNDLNKRAGKNVIDAELVTKGKGNRVLLSDFDNPDDPSDSSYGSVNPLDLEYLIAPGDSGGGLFIDGMLAGVHSFGWGRLDGNPNSDYGDVSGHTRVSSFTSWIDGIIGGGSSGGGNNGKKDKGGNGGGRSFAANTVQISEPGTFAIMGLGLAGLGFTARRRKAV
jgi:hypothetical protein